MLYYKYLGELLKAYRKAFNITQEVFAGKINIAEKTLQRWETDKYPANPYNLHAIANFTCIPMIVLNTLNAEYPVYYNIRKRRYALTKYETYEFIKEDLVKYNGPIDEGSTETYEAVSRMEDINKILQYDHQIYPTVTPLKSEVIHAAHNLLPDLNLIAKDPWGYHIGHLICLPLCIDTYNKIKIREFVEGNITSKHILDIMKENEGVLYFYSIYGASPHIAQNILLKAKKVIRQIVNKKTNYLVAGYSVTIEGSELCEKLRMKPVYENTAEYNKLRTEIAPTLYEGKAARILNIIMGKKQYTEKSFHIH
jgi:transcriptional regulator with XRE-family HTH domain